VFLAGRRDELAEKRHKGVKGGVDACFSRRVMHIWIVTRIIMHWTYEHGPA